MSRFPHRTAWIVAVLWLSFLQTAFSAPLLEGQSNYASSFVVSWQVFEDDAGDNPYPLDDQYTYLYWVQHTGYGASLFSFDLQGSNPPLFDLGNITATGFIPNTGVEPSVAQFGHWSGFDDDHLGAGERTATLYVNSPDVPGEIWATPYWCLECDQSPNFAVGPVSEMPGPGDYNWDGRVDSEDFDTWLASYGSDYWPADGNGDGRVSAADYGIWRDNLGTGTNLGGGASATFSIPEPRTLCLVLAGLALTLKQGIKKRAIR